MGILGGSVMWSGSCAQQTPAGSNTRWVTCTCTLDEDTEWHINQYLEQGSPTNQGVFLSIF